MPFAYIRTVRDNSLSEFVEIIWITPTEGVPPRPTPGPTPPGPGDPHPAFPIWGPPGFGPGAGFPDKPGYPSIPWPPTGPTGPIEPPVPGTPVLVFPLPPGVPPPPVPAGLPPDSTPIMIFYPMEKYGALAWVQPYPSSGPVPTPTAPTA